MPASQVQFILFLVHFQLSPVATLSGMANKCGLSLHFVATACSSRGSKPNFTLRNFEKQITPLAMNAAFCFKGLPGLKEDDEFSWSRNRPFQLRADLVGNCSFTKKSSTKLPEFVANTCIQSTLDQESKKLEEFDMQYLSAMPSSRPKSRRFSMTYVALIASAILRFPEKRLTLSQIYQVIEKSFPEFTVSRTGWKNTVRHNLSLHECFVKGDVSANGKSCYWHIHPAYIARFSKGDFRKRPSRDLCVVDDRTTQFPRVHFDRPQPYTIPYAFGGANSRFNFPYVGENHSASQVLYPTFSSSVLTPNVNTSTHSSTEWLRQYKPYPYYYLFSPKSAPFNSYQREKSSFANDSIHSSQ